MRIHLHQTHHTLIDFEKIFQYLKVFFDPNKDKLPLLGLHLFPEFFLSGYPLQDLCLHKSFIESYHTFLDQLDLWSQQELGQSLQEDQKENLALIMGGPLYLFDDCGLPKNIYNCLYLLRPGKKREVIYKKRLLPNYDIFDEKKYFTPGEDVGVWSWNQAQFALLICEDMWPSSSHPHDPCSELIQWSRDNQRNFDYIVNLSASPYCFEKHQKRISRGKEISHYLQAPFLYVNRVGGEDEILFDGQSFIVDGDTVHNQGSAFKQDYFYRDFSNLKERKDYTPVQHAKTKNTWETLFTPHLENSPDYPFPLIHQLTAEDCREIVSALQFGLQEYAGKNGFSSFLVALSGGIDSALCLTLATLSLKAGQHIEAIYMPSQFSGPIGLKLSQELCQNLKIKLNILPIKFLHSVCRNTFQDVLSSPLQGLSDENIQSRLRGLLLYARSNQTGAMVINTSNKSELAVGYSTLYGDSVGAISVLGDIYKSEVFQLANFLNQIHPGLIPQQIITQAPTAELRANQKDSDSLPPYPHLDTILECLLAHKMTAAEIIQLGFNKDEVTKTIKLYSMAEYKRFQFGPIIKIKNKSFGFGHRVPISKQADFYFN